MKGTSKTDDFQIRQITARERGYSYHTYQVTGYLNGERVRRRVKTLDEALGEKSRLTIKAANGAGEIHALNTRLNHDQVVEAEIAYRRLKEVPLSTAIDWFLATYKHAVHEIGLDPAIASFLAEKASHVRAPSMKDYRRTLSDLASAYTLNWREPRGQRPSKTRIFAQRRWAHFKRLCYPQDAIEGAIFLPAFDLSDIDPVNVANFRKVFLG